MTDRPGALLGGSRLRQLISTIQQAAKKRNEIPKDEMKEILDEFTQYAYSRGLPGDSLGGLIDILTTPSKLDQATTSSIIKSLYPRGKVREDIAVKIVGCFGQGQHKPALNIQAHLLRWLVMVYNVLEGYTMLSQLYGVLFSLLDMITLRTHLCHLLSLLTRRKHVKPFRIQALLELKQVVGNEQALLGLLQIYKDYYPDVIVERLPPSKAGLFSHPNPEWIERLLAIQEANALNSSAASAKFSFQVVRKYGGQGNKRRKTGHLTVPEVRTYRAVETSVTLEEIGDVDDLVSRLDKLELPNQLAAVIEDPLLQQVLGLLGSDTDLERVNNWLAAYFSCGVNDWTKNYLKKVLEYTKYTKRLLPAVETFLELYLGLQGAQITIFQPSRS
ncbi:centromere protein I [Kalaharituber pfeilii]|nr:centromere protein I [Kalaharituber pfeilii]